MWSAPETGFLFLSQFLSNPSIRNPDPNQFDWVSHLSLKQRKAEEKKKKKENYRWVFPSSPAQKEVSFNFYWLMVKFLERGVSTNHSPPGSSQQGAPPFLPPLWQMLAAAHQGLSCEKRRDPAHLDQSERSVWQPYLLWTTPAGPRARIKPVRRRWRCCILRAQLGQRNSCTTSPKDSPETHLHR